VTKRTIPKFVPVGALGALVVVFGIIWLVLAAPLFIPTTGGPGIGGFVFSVSRRAFNAVVVTFLALIVAGFLLIARTLWRRHLH
jgi:hypothetical protein